MPAEELTATDLHALAGRVLDGLPTAYPQMEVVVHPHPEQPRIQFWLHPDDTTAQERYRFVVELAAACQSPTIALGDERAVVSATWPDDPHGVGLYASCRVPEAMFEEHPRPARTWLSAHIVDP